MELNLTDGGTIAWITGTLVALVTVLAVIWIALRIANDEEIV